MNNKILTELPMKQGMGANKNKIVVDYKSLIGKHLKVLYDDEIYSIYIKNYIKTKVYIIYNKTEFVISKDSLKNCQLGKVFNKITKNFKINIGQNFKDKNRNLTVIAKEYRKNKNGYDEKWYKYHCNICHAEIWIIEHSLLQQETGCSCCCGRTVVKGINDIATTHPQLVEYFVNTEDTYKYTYNNAKKVLMKCPICGFKKEMCISNLYYQGFSCNSCSDGIKYPNKFMFNLLKQLDLKFEAEKRFKWCKYLFKSKYKQGIYDFYIPSMNLIIEMDGGFHKKDNSMSGQTIEESQYIDNEKDRLAREHDIEVIRIDCYYPNLEKRFKYIKQNILNDRLSELLNLSNINWIKCDEYSNKSLIEEVCRLKKDNPEFTTTDIGNITNLNKTSVCDYLKIGNEHGWCHYNAEEEFKKVLKQNISNKKKKIGIFKLNSDLCLGVFNGVRELSRKSETLFGVKLDNGCISKVCNGILNQHKGFVFNYM